ncbi:hypothetical protein BC941DRAFT_7355 [Chlamydoabsidia padenii]|nr:hypothetical protein BC941DRAFT_7355 [Chlamydoabsidia padenii]
MNTDPTPPPQHCLSNVRINKDINIDHNAALKKLGRYRQSFANQQKFWVEVSLLDRLNYKGKNQHRHFHRFKRSCEVRYCLFSFS